MCITTVNWINRWDGNWKKYCASRFYSLQIVVFWRMAFHSLSSYSSFFMCGCLGLFSVVFFEFLVVPQADFISTAHIYQVHEIQ